MITIEDFGKLNLRIASVTSARKHPDAERLLVLQVNLGGEERQLVAGIKEYYSPDDLVGKQIVVVENLQPTTIRGVESQGMLLAAQDRTGIVIISPEKPVEAGCPVS